MKHIKSRIEFLTEENIYVNKYRLETVNKPLIIDAMKIISKNPHAVKFTNKEEFDKFAHQQKYFSAAESHAFFTEEEYDSWNMNNQKSPEAEASKILFEVGHEIVQVWDDKHKVGYVIPDDKTDGQLKRQQR